MEKRKKFLAIIIIFSSLLFVIAFGFVLGCQKSSLKNGNEEINKNPSSEKNNTAYTINKNNIKGYIEKLASEEFAGRRTGTGEEGEAALYLANELKKIGVKPLGEKDTYFQSYPLPQTGLRQEGKRTAFFLKEGSSELIGDNILGVVEGKVNANQYIVLSAHFDHLGVWQNQLYPGANDNASGVALILEIAKGLVKHSEKLPYSVIIAFWSGEEMGLLGSNHFINNPTIDLNKVKLNINFDSIGTGAENDFILWSEGSPTIIDNLHQEFSHMEKVAFSLQTSIENSSDHKSFAEVGIPAVTILAANWLEGNHTPLDSPILLNYDKIASLAQEVLSLLGSNKLINVLSEN